MEKITLLYKFLGNTILELLLKTKSYEKPQIKESCTTKKVKITGTKCQVDKRHQILKDKLWSTVTLHTGRGSRQKNTKINK